MPEEKTRSPFAFLHDTPVLVVTGLLVLQIVLFKILPTKEHIPTPPPLSGFARSVGPWHTNKESQIDAYTQNLLKADDTLTREYKGPGQVELFVAFFKSQRAGVTPHSPKICLPANGWTEETSAIIRMDVPGEAASIPVNRYVVSNEGKLNLVFYWYQNQHRVTANEYLSKFYLIWDSLRYHRSDEALVRVIVDMKGKQDEDAEAQARQFIRDIYQPLKQQMWSGPSSAAVIQNP